MNFTKPTTDTPIVSYPRIRKECNIPTSNISASHILFSAQLVTCVIRGWRKSWRRWLILVEWSWELLLLLSSTALLAVRSLLRCILAVGQAWLKFTRKYRNNLPTLLFPSWSPNLTFLHFSFLSTQKYNMAQQGNQMILNRFVRLQFECKLYRVSSASVSATNCYVQFFCWHLTTNFHMLIMISIGQYRGS